MSAGIATLNELFTRKNDYLALNGKVKEICETIVKEAARNNIAVDVSFFKSMFSLRFAGKDIFRHFYKKLLSSGVYIAPSEYESNFLSFAHSKADIDKTKKAIKDALKSLKGRRS